MAYVEVRRIGPRRCAWCGLGDRASVGDAGERVGVGGNTGRCHQRRAGRPLCVRALSLLVETGLLRTSLLQLLCRAAALLVLAPTPLVVSASVRAVTTPP